MTISKANSQIQTITAALKIKKRPFLGEANTNQETTSCKIFNTVVAILLSALSVSNALSRHFYFGVGGVIFRIFVV